MKFADFSNNSVFDEDIPQVDPSGKAELALGLVQDDGANSESAIGKRLDDFGERLRDEGGRKFGVSLFPDDEGNREPQDCDCDTHGAVDSRRDAGEIKSGT